MACVGLVIVTLYNTTSRLSRKQSDALRDYEQTLLARALLDEYRATYPLMPSYGTYKDTWDWQITEQPQNVLKPTRFDHHFELVLLTAVVSNLGSQKRSVAVNTVVARRGTN